MIGSTSTGDHRTYRLMMLNPLAPAFLPHYQPPSDPTVSLCNYTTMFLPWLNYFLECLHQSPHLMLLLLPNLSLTALSSSFFFNRRIYLSRMQMLINHFLDLQLVCLHLSIIKCNIYSLFTRPFNSSTNTWRQNNSTERHYNVFSLNLRMTSIYCATCFSLRLEQFPSMILPLKTPLPVHQLTLTLL